MLFLAYIQWHHESGGGPIKIERHDTREDLTLRLNDIDDEFVRNGTQYDIIMVVEGREFNMEQRQTWHFTEKNMPTIPKMPLT